MVLKFRYLIVRPSFFAFTLFCLATFSTASFGTQKTKKFGFGFEVSGESTVGITVSLKKENLSDDEQKILKELLKGIYSANTTVCRTRWLPSLEPGHPNFMDTPEFQKLIDSEKVKKWAHPKLRSLLIEDLENRKLLRKIYFACLEVYKRQGFEERNKISGPDEVLTENFIKEVESSTGIADKNNIIDASRAKSRAIFKKIKSALKEFHKVELIEKVDQTLHE